MSIMFLKERALGCTQDAHTAQLIDVSDQTQLFADAVRVDGLTSLHSKLPLRKRIARMVCGHLLAAFHHCFEIRREYGGERHSLRLNSLQIHITIFLPPLRLRSARARKAG